jgi:hypothetical protein
MNTSVPAHVLVDADEDLAVGKPGNRASCELDAQAASDFLRQHTIRRAREQLEPAARDDRLVHC